MRARPRAGEDPAAFRACGRKRRYETRVEAAKAAEKSSRRKDALGVCAHTVGTVEGDLLHTREEWIEKDSLRRGLAVILALMLAHATDVGSR